MTTPTLVQDVRYGLRMLRKTPGFTAVAVITLALGMGANTAMFGALSAFVLRPFPFHDPDKLVIVWEANPKLEGFLAQRVPTCLSNFLDWKSESKSFTDMAAMQRHSDLSLTGVDKPEQLDVGKVSVNFFAVLGTGASAGRTFAPGEGEPGKDHVAVLTLPFFEKLFGQGAEPSGKTIQLNRETYTIVGVLTRDFQIPALWAGLDQEKEQLFIPLNTSLSQPKEALQDRTLLVYGRLKPGVTVEQARTEMQVIGKRLEERDPRLNQGFGTSVFPMRAEDLGSDMHLALLVLQFAVGFVLLIACANLANLLLARAAGREKETAVRIALGASHGRVITQFIVESMLLSFFGGLLGLGLARWGTDAINKFAPKDILGAHVLRFDVRVFVFTFLVVAAAGLLFGIAPAIYSVRQNINETLARSSRSVVGGSRKMRSALVIGEVTLAVVLLVGAGLTLHSLYALRRVNPGFIPDHLLTAMIRLPQQTYGTPEKTSAFCTELLEKLRALPEVKSAALVDGLPMQSISATGFHIEGQPLPSKNDYLIADRRAVTEDYFKTMGSPVVVGRPFTRQEIESDNSHVVLINHTMAQKFWPAKDPMGQVIITGQEKEARWAIVGVIADSHQLGLDTAPRAEMYFPAHGFSRFSVVARTAGDPMQLANSLTAQVLSLDRDLPVSEIHPMSEIVNDTMGGERFGTSMMLCFAVLALILSAVGLYGVLGYLVGQRKQEIGIRLALGAQRNGVLGMVVRQGIVLAGIGILVGLAGAFFLARVMSSLLYGVSTTDPLTFLVTAMVLFIVSLAASFVPAFRASRVDPMVALRYE